VTSAHTVFHAIADPTRRDLLILLRDGERSASDLAAPFDVTRSAVSQHLGVLLEAGLVARRRAGRRRLYSLRAEPLREVHSWVHIFSEFWDGRLEHLGEYLDGGGEP
jgi:DNA-binding transcriptional ArsR family regulator